MGGGGNGNGGGGSGGGAIWVFMEQMRELLGPSGIDPWPGMGSSVKFVRFEITFWPDFIKFDNAF